MRWYVVMCGGSAGFLEQRRIIPEFAAVARISDEGYDAWCPIRVVLTRARHGQRLRQRLIMPLWDGYAFARLDDRALSQRLTAWRDAGDVWDVIRQDGQPFPLADELIDWLRALDADGPNGDVTGAPKEEIVRLLQVGQTVEHRGAAFQGLTGTITKVDRDNIELLLTLLGGTRTVKAKAADLEVVA